MPSGLPLPSLLSAALVAFTVEFDNEAEHRLPHRTTRSGPSVRLGNGPFLVSQVMWTNVLQYVGEDGVRIADLHARARTTRDSLTGLERWRYVTVEAAGGKERVTSSPADGLVRLTDGGRLAARVWRPLAGIIEGRWEDRFDAGPIASLRRSLGAVVDQVDERLDLPDYLPVVHPTQNGRAEVPPVRPATPGGRRRGDVRSLDLSALLARALLAFTIDFEQASRISLPISANTLRVLDHDGVRVRDIPSLTGVSKEANSMAVGFLARHGCAEVVADPAATRGKLVRLTDKGGRARAKYLRVLAATEREWEERFGCASAGGAPLIAGPVGGRPADGGGGFAPVRGSGAAS